VEGNQKHYPTLQECQELRDLEVVKYIKTFEGKTLTYYPKSTSTEKPTLRYPASNGKSWDKIRYE